MVRNVHGVPVNRRGIDLRMTDTAVLGPIVRPSARPGELRVAPRFAVPALSFLLFLCIALHLVATAPFPGNDELEHVSYAAWLQENGRVLPRFEEQRTLRRDDFARWDWRPNYVGHPWPFYVLIARVLDRDLPPAQAVLAPRLVSLGLLAAAVALALAAGARAFGRDVPALVTFCLLVALCPQMLSISGMVTNDSLAMLGGALTVWGLAAVGRRMRHDVAAGAGLMLALWAKPNAGIEAGLLIVGVLALAREGRARLFAAAVVGGVTGLLPILPIVFRYGAVVPVTAESVWEVASIADPLGYLAVFLPNLGNTWGYLRVGAWPLAGAAAVPTMLAVAGLLGCAGWGAVLARRRGDPPVAVAGVIAFAVVLPIHAGFAATRLGGSLPAAAFRYDLPLWPALALGVAATVAYAPRPWHRGAAAGVGAAALILGWLPG